MDEYYVVEYVWPDGTGTYWLSLTRDLPAGCYILNGGNKLTYRLAVDFIHLLTTSWSADSLEGS